MDVMSPHGRPEAKAPDTLTRWLAMGGVFGPILYVLLFTLAGLLRPGYSPIHDAVSDLGVGPNAWLLNVPGVLNWLLLTALVIAFLRRTRMVVTARLRWLCAALLALPPLGFGVASIFTEDPATLAIHWMVGALLAFMVPVFALTVTGIALRRNWRWRCWGNYSLIAGPATLVLVGFMFWVFAPGTPIAPARLGGLMERIVIIEILGWYVIAGWQLSQD